MRALLHMHPAFAPHNVGHGCPGDAVPGRQLVGGNAPVISGTNVAHILLGHSSIRRLPQTVLRPVRVAVLDNTILHVLPMCAKPKVSRVHTKWVVSARTIMAYLLPLRDRPIPKLVSNAVGFLSPIIDSKAPIAGTGCSAGPKPAAVGVRGLGHLLPKAYFKWYTSHVVASDQVTANPGLFVAAPGISMPNYSTFDLPSYVPEVQ